MTQPKLSDTDFVRLFETLGAAKTAERLGIGVRRVYSRRQRLEGDIGRQITAPEQSERVTRFAIEHPQRFALDVFTGIGLVGSDAHYWPKIVTTAHKAFVKFCGDLQPKFVCLNGDVLDGARASRHPPIGWDKTPELIDEIETCQERTTEIKDAAANAKLLWTLGNHDGRFETRLATVAPEYARVHGTSLKDHFPYWHPCWSAWINDDTVIKHRFKGGVHATHNNTVYAGKNMVTGHLHSLKTTPFTDYNGTRFGVDSGTLAGGPTGPQFVDYMEDNPANWRSGFAVLTFYRGRLLWPEVVHVFEDGKYEFRGRVHTI